MSMHVHVRTCYICSVNKELLDGVAEYKHSSWFFGLKNYYLCAANVHFCVAVKMCSGEREESVATNQAL